jgi:hypothetical protein
MRKKMKRKRISRFQIHPPILMLKLVYVSDVPAPKHAAKKTTAFALDSVSLVPHNANANLAAIRRNSLQEDMLRFK